MLLCRSIAICCVADALILTHTWDIAIAGNFNLNFKMDSTTRLGPDRTFSEHSQNILRTFSEHSQNKQKLSSLLLHIAYLVACAL